MAGRPHGETMAGRPSGGACALAGQPSAAPLEVDVAVVGAGPAGLAAATAAREAGAQEVLVLEREPFAGGVLPQCVHDGFGVRRESRSLTGPEYAQLWRSWARSSGVRVALGTTVLSVSRAAEPGAGAGAGASAASDVVGADREQEGEGALGAGAPWFAPSAASLSVAEGPFPFLLDCVGAPLGGRRLVRARAVVAATGCRERTRGQLGIPGTRPAGVMTAGTAQYMMNVANQLPGDKAVVLGTGDIGLIMARRLVLEGAEVRLVLGQQPAGLLRNRLRCIDDFGLELRYGWGVAKVHGVGRLKGVTVAPMGQDGSFDLARRQYVRCNLLLLACGLVPEREVLAGLGEAGPAQGLFVCGNAERPHDLVDDVTDESLLVGWAAACHALGRCDGESALAKAQAAQAAQAAGAGQGARSGAEAQGSRQAQGLPKLPSMLGQRRPRSEAPPAKDTAERPAKGRQVVCTVCPKGCVMEARRRGPVGGNACSRGQAYAKAELSRPMRLFTGTVRIEGGPATGPGSLLPVRSASEVPLAKLAAVARAARQVRARAPLWVGDAVCRNVAGTGVDLVASSPLPVPDVQERR